MKFFLFYYDIRFDKGESGLSPTAHAGEILKGSVICYGINIKEELLQVTKGMIDQYAPKSPEITKTLTHGLKRVNNADIFVGIIRLSRSPYQVTSNEDCSGSIEVREVSGLRSRLLTRGSLECVT